MSPSILSQMLMTFCRKIGLKDRSDLLKDGVLLPGSVCRTTDLEVRDLNSPSGCLSPVDGAMDNSSNNWLAG